MQCKGLANSARPRADLGRELADALALQSLAGGLLGSC